MGVWGGVEIDGGDGSETASVAEGEEQKSTTSIDARLSPDFRNKEERTTYFRFNCGQLVTVTSHPQPRTTRNS